MKKTNVKRYPAIRAAVESFGPGGACIAQIAEATGFERDRVTTTVGQYVRAGTLFGAGDAGIRRYFISAADAAAYKQEKPMRAFRWEIIKAFIEKNGGSANHLEVHAGTGLTKKITATLLPQYVTAGKLYKGWGGEGFRYYLSKESVDENLAKGRIDRAGLTEQALAYIKAAGEKGATKAEIAKSLGLETAQLDHPFAMLQKRSLMFSVKLFGGVRRFATQEWAEAAEGLDLTAEQRKERKNKQAEESRRRSLARKGITKAVKVQKSEPKPGKELVKPAKKDPHADYMRGPAFRPEPAQNIDSVKVERIPTSKHWTEVTGPIVGGFSNMRPGQYLPSDSAVARAMAQRQVGVRAA